jgi:multicomponent Na+:H+ antiporter subunit E
VAGVLSYIFSFLVLLSFWLVLSGHFHTLLIVLALLSSLIVVYLTNDMFFPNKKVNLKLIVKIFLYVPLLLKEIILSNIQILKILLRKDIRNTINPIMVEFEPKVKSDIGVTLLGNSITLTPGTVTIFASDKQFLVHAIDKGFESGIYSLQEKVEEVEKAI